jgi:DNA modification methylase
VTVRVLQGDCRDRLKEMPDGSVHCVVSSPPYFGLRDYGVEQQIGLEVAPQEFIDELVAVFREVRRVLRDDGTLWLNMGDSYANDGKWGGHTGGKHAKALHASPIGRNKRYSGLKPKDLIGIPWRLALALQADGWFLRQDIIWSKPNPMPESVDDRCTKAHEYLFLLSKSPRYFYDADAIMEGLAETSIARLAQGVGAQSGSARVPGKTNGPMKAVSRRRGIPPRHAQYGSSSDQHGFDSVGRGAGRNKRSVWTVSTVSFDLEHCTACWTTFKTAEHRALRREKTIEGDTVVESRVFCGCGRHDAWLSHFATFPPELIQDCIKAGCPVGGTVLDPFFGAGTTGLVADRLGRNAVGIELNAHYVAMAKFRLKGDGGLFTEVEAA